MKKCTDCYWYPRSFWRKLFNLPPVYNEYAKCSNPNVGTPNGEKPYCSIERDFRFDNTPYQNCKSTGLLFRPWNGETAKAVKKHLNALLKGYYNR